LLTKHVVDYVKSRVPVVATGSFGLSVEDKAVFTKKIYDTGVDAVIMITGHFAKVEDPDETLLKNFEKMFALTSSIPLGIYECPAPYKRIIPATIFKKLLDSGRLVYHKDTSIELEQVKAKLEVAKDFSRFEFYDAHTPNAMYSMQMGAKGMSSISGNFYPEVLVWMCDNVNDPAKQEDVKWLQSELTRVDPLIHIAYPLSAKYFLQKRGLPVRTISRAQAIQLTPEQRKILDDINDSFLRWCERLDIEPVNTNSL
jgi:4-hydroxy-tetrahydrodipicolinate synthase